MLMASFRMCGDSYLPHKEGGFKPLKFFYVAHEERENKWWVNLTFKFYAQEEFFQFDSSDGGIIAGMVAERVYSFNIKPESN